MATERMLTERSAKDYTFHAYGRTEGICGIAITDHAYPALVAHQLLSKVVDEFLSNNPRSSWSTGTPSVAYPQLRGYVDKYQDPNQADSILKIQKELDGESSPASVPPSRSSAAPPRDTD